MRLLEEAESNFITAAECLEDFRDKKDTERAFAGAMLIGKALISVIWKGML